MRKNIFLKVAAFYYWKQTDGPSNIDMMMMMMVITMMMMTVMMRKMVLVVVMVMKTVGIFCLSHLCVRPCAKLYTNYLIRPLLVNLQGGPHSPRTLNFSKIKALARGHAGSGGPEGLSGVSSILSERSQSAPVLFFQRYSKWSLCYFIFFSPFLEPFHGLPVF